MLGEQIARSKEKYFLVGEWRYVASLLLNKHKSFSAIKFSIIAPLSFVSEQPQSLLWLLKSPNKMKGRGNWFIRFSKSCLEKKCHVEEDK